jgi:hypothetical protein
VSQPLVLCSDTPNLKRVVALGAFGFLALTVAGVLFAAGALKGVKWPPGWPALVQPVTAAYVAVVGGVLFSVLFAGLWLSRRTARWRIFPGVAQVSTFPNPRRRVVLAGELEVVESNEHRFRLVRRDDPAWVSSLFPLIAPFHSEAQRREFEAWLAAGSDEAREVQPASWRSRGAWSLLLLALWVVPIVVATQLAPRPVLAPGSLMGHANPVLELCHVAGIIGLNLVLLGLALGGNPTRAVLTPLHLVVGRWSFERAEPPQIELHDGVSLNGRGWRLGHGQGLQTANLLRSVDAEVWEEALREAGWDVTPQRSGTRKGPRLAVAAGLLVLLLLQPVPWLGLPTAFTFARHEAESAHLVYRASDRAPLLLVLNHDSDLLGRSLFGRVSVEESSLGALFSRRLPRVTFLRTGGLSSSEPVQLDDQGAVLLVDRSRVSRFPLNLPPGLMRLMTSRQSKKGLLLEQLETEFEGQDLPVPVRAFLEGRTTTRLHRIYGASYDLVWCAERGAVAWLVLGARGMGPSVGITRLYDTAYFTCGGQRLRDLAYRVWPDGRQRSLTWKKEQAPDFDVLLAATRQVRRGEATVRQALEPLFPHLFAE